MLNTIIALLLPILSTVESNNDNYAIGDNGKAVGCLQIHMVVIQDVNRIYNTNFVSHDRYDRQISFRIASLYLRHYGEANAEQLARTWNGGPKGVHKAATDKYWFRVQKEIKLRRIK